jgi:hypothetical protein
VAAVRTPTANVVRAVAFATAVLLIATGCGGASSHYVVNKPSQTYFKLPKEWQATQLNGADMPEAAVLRDGAWTLFFAPEGVPKEALLGDPAEAIAPIGLMQVGQLEQGQYDAVTEKNLRVISFTTADGEDVSIDPLAADITQDDDLVRVIGIEPIVRDGLRGYRTRFELLAPAPAPSIVYDRITLVHDATHLLYSFRVYCTAACFGSYVDSINEIIASLRIRRDQP